MLDKKNGFHNWWLINGGRPNGLLISGDHLFLDYFFFLGSGGWLIWGVLLILTWHYKVHMYPLSPLIDGSSSSWVAEPRTQPHVPCIQNTACTALRLRGVDVDRSERIVWARPDYQVAPIQPDTWVEWCLWGPDVVLWGEKWPKFRDRVFGGISWNIGVFQVSCFVEIPDLEHIEICFGAPMMAKTAYSAFLIASRTLHCVSHGKSDKRRSKRRMPQKWLAGNSIYILHIYI